MEISGVDPLKPQSKTPPLEKKKPFEEESITFDSDVEWKLNRKLLKNSKKYAGTAEKRKKNAAKQRQRLTPGFIPDIEIDLHGLSRDRAHQIIKNIFDIQNTEKFRNVLIITGRGLNSEKEGGILKEFVWNWLTNNQHRMDYRFRFAPPFLGGNGAIIVFFS